jgi:HSP20 family protein
MSNLIMFDPLHELDRVRTEMNRVFSDSFNRLPSYENSSNDVGFIPPVDIYMTNDELITFINLPGIHNIQDVEVSATKDTLSISGEIKPATIPEGATCLRQERDLGQFKRVFRLPVPVQHDKVTASFKDGVLGIKLPKAEELKGHVVKIDVN